MLRRIGLAILVGVLGIIFLPHLKTVMEAVMSFATSTSPIVNLISDNIYLIMIGLWLLIIALILFWHRGSSDEKQGQ